MIDFNKIPPGYITKDFILSKVSDSQIFYYYFGKFELRKAYPSVFSKDKHPSTGFFIGKSGELVYRDWRDGRVWNCFQFVAALYGLKYYRALEKIANEFGLLDESKKIVSEKIIKEGMDMDTTVKGKTIIQFKPEAWSDKNLLFWRRYEIVQPELEENNVYPIRELYINKQKIYNRDNHIRYAYVVKHKGEDYVKIYSPTDPKMKWVSNIPLDIPFGLETLKHASSKIIITKSQKDLIVLKKIFDEVIATQNESEGSFPQWLQDRILEDYENRIIFWDNDSTGVEQCTKFNSKGFGYFNIPKEYYDQYKIKDASDFVLYYGLDALKDLFKQKNIL